jgi:hypothetical protein
MNWAQAYARLATIAPYVDAAATWPGTPTLDAGGSITASGTATSYPCKAQFDAPTQQMREAEGFLQTDVRILVLAASLAVPLDTAARIVVTSGPNAGTWALLTCQGDPAGVGYECRGRRA